MDSIKELIAKIQRWGFSWYHKFKNLSIIFCNSAIDYPLSNAFTLYLKATSIIKANIQFYPYQ